MAANRSKPDGPIKFCPQFGTGSDPELAPHIENSVIGMGDGLKAELDEQLGN